MNTTQYIEYLEALIISLVENNEIAPQNNKPETLAGLEQICSKNRVTFPKE